MPVISAKKMQDRRDSILAAAREAFAKRGFEGTSIADIARAAGVSEGLVYRYFANKRDLLNAADRRAMVRPLPAQSKALTRPGGAAVLPRGPDIAGIDACAPLGRN